MELDDVLGSRLQSVGGHLYHLALYGLLAFCCYPSPICSMDYFCSRFGGAVQLSGKGMVAGVVPAVAVGTCSHLGGAGSGERTGSAASRLISCNHFL